MADVKLELTLSAELFAKLEAEAEEQERTLSQVIAVALWGFLDDMRDMEEDTPDEEIEAGLRIGLRQALAGEGRDVREWLREKEAEQERREAGVGVRFSVKPVEIWQTDNFERQFRQLRKKYPKITEAYDSLLTELEEGEKPGDKIPNVGYDTRKVRLANSSAGKGKSGGFRVIYYIQLVDRIWILTIYDKSRRENLSPEQIRKIIEDYIRD